MRKGHEQEIDLSNLLKHLLQSGTEKKQESDEDSFLAAVLLLRVRSSQFDMSLSGRVSLGKSAGCVNGPNTNTCSNTTASIASFFAHWSCYSAVFKDQFY